MKVRHQPKDQKEKERQSKHEIGAITFLRSVPLEDSLRYANQNGFTIASLARIIALFTNSCSQNTEEQLAIRKALLGEGIITSGTLVAYTGLSTPVQDRIIFREYDIGQVPEKLALEVSLTVPVGNQSYAFAVEHPHFDIEFSHEKKSPQTRKIRPHPGQHFVHIPSFPIASDELYPFDNIYGLPYMPSRHNPSIQPGGNAWMYRHTAEDWIGFASLELVYYRDETTLTIHLTKCWSMQSVNMVLEKK